MKTVLFPLLKSLPVKDIVARAYIINILNSAALSISFKKIYLFTQSLTGERLL